MMFYCIYYEEVLPKETPIPIAVGFLDMERTGAYKCGGKHLTNDVDFSLSDSSVSHTENFNCDTNNLDIPAAYECGIRCYTQNSNEGNNLAYSFKGIKFLLYGTKANGNGKFDVELDGEIIDTVDEQYSGHIPFTSIYTSDLLVYKEHRVRLLHKSGNQFEFYKLAYWPSINAIRMNSTMFPKTGTWIKESDGIGGIREYTSEGSEIKTGTFSTLFSSSKFWLFGTLADHLEGMTLKINQNAIEISQMSEHRKDSTIIHEYNESAYDLLLISGTTKGDSLISCIFYQTRPSVTEYIDKIFIKTLPYFQIHVVNSMITQISGCKFINIAEDFNYFITLEQEVLFIDDDFQYDSQQTNSPAPIEICYNGRVTLRNCRFANSKSRTNNGGNVFHCSEDFSIETSFESCEFIDCGNSKDKAIIKVGSLNSKINMFNFRVTYSNSEVSSRVIDSHCISATLNDCAFRKTAGIEISRPTEQNPSDLQITKCIFDSCNEDMGLFLYLSPARHSSLVFEDNIICNIKRNDGLDFIINFDFFSELKFKNVSFVNNSCASLLGRGSGINIQNANKLSFNDCKFINNKAWSDGSGRNKIWPEIDENYRSGDGGGIQFGFSYFQKDSALIFEGCLFKDNQAIRHGGGLAIQTTNSVEINHCTFISNSANCRIDSSLELLYENHFHKKTQGRGGAVYINPSFSYKYNPEQNSFHMTSCTINECSFSQNLAIDGYAIYIEGDDPETIFEITDNNFNSNYNIDPDNDPNITIRGVITTEIHRISEDILSQNVFLNDEISAKPKKLIYVDHYGNRIATKIFSESTEFTYSNAFTYSDHYSPSFYFIPTKMFSETIKFSQSRQFSSSNKFSLPQTEKITNHYDFSDLISSEKISSNEDDSISSEEMTSSNDEESSSKENSSNFEVEKSNEEYSSNEEESSNEELISKEEVTSYETAPSREYVSSNEEVSISEQLSSDDEVPSNEEDSSSETETISSEDASSNEEVSSSEELTSDEIPSSEESTSGKEIASNEVVSDSEEVYSNKETISNDESASNEEAASNEDKSDSEYTADDNIYLFSSKDEAISIIMSILTKEPTQIQNTKEPSSINPTEEITYNENPEVTSGNEYYDKTNYDIFESYMNSDISASNNEFGNNKISTEISTMHESTKNIEHGNPNTRMKNNKKNILLIIGIVIGVILASILTTLIIIYFKI